MSSQTSHLIHVCQSEAEPYGLQQIKISDPIDDTAPSEPLSIYTINVYHRHMVTALMSHNRTARYHMEETCHARS